MESVQGGGLADGAGGGTRTPDLDFTKVLLYQLSYAGTALRHRR